MVISFSVLLVFSKVALMCAVVSAIDGSLRGARSPSTARLILQKALPLSALVLVVVAVMVLLFGTFVPGVGYRIGW